MNYCFHESPVGQLLIAGQTRAEWIHFAAGRPAGLPEPDWEYTTAPFSDLLFELSAYFNGDLTRFSIDMTPTVGTPFQQSVWQALADIPYGRTVSYSGLAKRIGHPKAVRAVGSAVGKNPLPIVIPCHRVIRKNGDVGQFGGGVAVKKQLLALEGVSL